MTANRSLASLARQLERAIPEGFPPFDAAAFLNGTYQLPTDFQNSPLPGLGEGSGVREQHHPDCPDAPWNTPNPKSPNSPLPGVGEGSGVRDRASALGEESGVRDESEIQDPKSVDQVPDQVPDIPRPLNLKR